MIAIWRLDCSFLDNQLSILHPFFLGDNSFFSAKLTLGPEILNKEYTVHSIEINFHIRISGRWGIGPGDIFFGDEYSPCAAFGTIYIRNQTGHEGKYEETNMF
jgi:hypothetical protein